MDVKKLFSFDGRIGRGVFWGIGISSSIVGSVAWTGVMGGYNALVTLLALVIALATLVVGLTTNVKRWHDRDKSGWWYFIILVPIVGPIWAVVELGFLAGTDGVNQYGFSDSGSPFVSEPLPSDAIA